MARKMSPPMHTSMRHNMIPNAGICQIRGDIIEAFQTECHAVLRVSVTGGSIDFAADPGETFHLGDSVLLDGEFRLCTARHAIEPDKHPLLPDADFLS